ncbi:MAG: YigZ family protein [Peptoniphilus sp.]|nr:YigZ family protein [Peptoniphilus sp.]
MYRSLLKDGSDEFIERKSRFIGYGFKVQSEEEALEKIDMIKKKHRDATHNCSAYIIGEDKMIQRYNDDGEPSGTAGVPILEVLKKEDLTDVCVVVTRYFGGILLGAGGLVRAYSKGAKIAVDSSVIVDMEEYERLSVNYDYTHHGTINNYLMNREYRILKEEFLESVTLEIHNKKGDETLAKELMDITAGTVKIKSIGDEILPCKNGKIIYP